MPSGHIETGPLAAWFISIKQQAYSATGGLLFCSAKSAGQNVCARLRVSAANSSQTSKYLSTFWKVKEILPASSSALQETTQWNTRRVRGMLDTQSVFSYPPHIEKQLLKNREAMPWLKVS